MEKLRAGAVIKKMTAVAIDAIFFLFPFINDFNNNTRVVFQF